MARIPSVFLVVTLGTAALCAQTGPRSVQATGSATIFANPDQAQLEIGVVTNAGTAQDSAQQNATMTSAVLIALKAVLGSSGTVQTVSYSVNPRYDTSRGQSNVIVGYTTSNMVRVTTTDLSIIGKLIDAANQAGANSVGGLSFGLQDPEPRVQQALAADFGSHHALVTDLFESGGVERCHFVLVVSAPLRLQRERVMRRPGMSNARFADILRHRVGEIVRNLSRFGTQPGVTNSFIESIYKSLTAKK
jgi:uncharacterized protein YggE